MITHPWRNGGAWRAPRAALRLRAQPDAQASGSSDDELSIGAIGAWSTDI
jgi:hypothetical protein